MKRIFLVALGAVAGFLALWRDTEDRAPRVVEAMASRFREMMPPEAPPAQMRRDLSVFREQTDRILRRLEECRDGPN